jgi:NAD(P)-dependent dehydrogenase (short-subunit alcohol dehydrogenase family)
MYLVIGGSSGIGKEIARQLLGEGKSVLITGRNEEKLGLAAEELGCPFQVCDARDIEAVDKLFKAQSDVEGAVNCAGSILLKPAHLSSESDYQETLDSNLKTAFAVVRAAGKSMKDGSIVLFSSAAARHGLPNHELVAAAKGAVESLVRSAAATYAAKRLRFNAIAPGLVETPMAERLTSRPAAREASVAQHPLGRLGSPQEVASLACWLLGSHGSWVTGQVFGVDGGLATVKGR